jgi:hypothetical protein
MASSVINTCMKKAHVFIRYHKRATTEITQNQTGGEAVSELCVVCVSADSSIMGYQPRGKVLVGVKYIR